MSTINKFIGTESRLHGLEGMGNGELSFNGSRDYAVDDKNFGYR